MTPATAARLVDALGDAFASGDVATVLRCFAADGDVLYAGSEDSEVAVGAAAVTSLLEDLFARDERYSWRCRNVHVLRLPPVATGGVLVAVVAEATLTVHPVGGGAPNEDDLPYRVSGLLEKQGDGWAWRVCEGAEPAPPVMLSAVHPAQHRSDPAQDGGGRPVDRLVGVDVGEQQT